MIVKEQLEPLEAVRSSPPRRYERRQTRSPASLGDSTALPRNRILVGDARTHLAQLPGGTVDCCVTSPPYYRLRDYGVAGQLGREPHINDWVSALRGVLTEVARVLKPTGALWLNLGDVYSSAQRYGAPPKGLLLGPERLLLALAQDGWLVRNKVIWAKADPMPSPVTDRLGTAHDVVYLLVRRPRYLFQLDEIRKPLTREGYKHRMAAGRPNHRLPADQHRRYVGSNPGDVWWLPSGHYQGGHFATFPERLIERPLLATCPERLCDGCGAAWRRDATRHVIGDKQPPRKSNGILQFTSHWRVEYELGSLGPTCSCAGQWRPGVVLDPFFGTGTVGVVAERLRRDWLGIELNPAYVQLAERRLRAARNINH